MNKCSKCRGRIKSHLWIVDDRIFCSPSCQRNGKSEFEKVYKALANMKKN